MPDIYSAEPTSVFITPAGDRIVFPSRFLRPLLRLLNDFANRFKTPLERLPDTCIDLCLALVMAPL